MVSKMGSSVRSQLHLARMTKFQLSRAVTDAVPDRSNFPPPLTAKQVLINTSDTLWKFLL